MNPDDGILRFLADLAEDTRAFYKAYPALSPYGKPVPPAESPKVSEIAPQPPETASERPPCDR